MVASTKNLQIVLALAISLSVLSVWVWRSPKQDDAFLRSRQVGLRVLCPIFAVVFWVGAAQILARDDVTADLSSAFTWRSMHVATSI